MSYGRRLSDTVAVVRSYNNVHIVTLVGLLLSYNLGKVFVVINSALDMGSTKKWLEHINDPRLELIEIEENYSWSIALNQALMNLMIHNATAPGRGDRQFRFIFNVSVEAKFTKEQIEKMLDAATDDPEVTVVGTSFKGKQKGSEVPLGRSYRHPRNTGMLIRIENLGAFIPSFDTRCDAIGGMEDIDFVLRMLALSNFKYLMLDLKVELIIGAHHNQEIKEEREQEAMENIIAHWRTRAPVIGSKYRERVEDAIYAMDLEPGLNQPLKKGALVTWNEDALKRIQTGKNRDYLDRALVCEGAILELVNDFNPGDREVLVSNGSGNFTANPKSLRPINK